MIGSNGGNMATIAEAPAASPQAPFDTIGTDLSSVIGSIQGRVDELRQAAESEISRLRTEQEAERNHHQGERTRLEGEIAQLRAAYTSQLEKVRELQEQLKLLLADYRGDLDGQIQRAYGARRQLDRIQQVLGSVEELAAPGTGTPREVRSLHSLEDRRNRALGGVDSNAPTTVIEPTEVPEETTGTLSIAISGVMSVSAMMRVRRAVEMQPGLQVLESRHDAGTMSFTVKTEQSAEALVSALTTLSEPALRAVSVSEDSIELQMQ